MSDKQQLSCARQNEDGQAAAKNADSGAVDIAETCHEQISIVNVVWRLVHVFALCMDKDLVLQTRMAPSLQIHE